MKLLAIETSTEACSVAIRANGVGLERFEHAPRGHAERVLPWVQALLAEAGLALSDLDAVAFSRGPGSFTSLRIGISVVQGLAWGADVPVAPVSSLRATAQSAVPDGVERAVVALDARMGEVFTGRYALGEGSVMQASDGERVCGPGEVELLHGWTGVGNGFERFEKLANRASQLAEVRADVWPRAGAVAELAEQWLADNEPWSPDRAQPVYLRDRVAEKSGTQPIGEGSAGDG